MKDHAGTVIHILLMVLMIVVSSMWGFHMGAEVTDLKSYQEGHEACMEWYRIDPEEREKEAQGL